VASRIQQPRAGANREKRDEIEALHHPAGGRRLDCRAADDACSRVGQAVGHLGVGAASGGGDRTPRSRQGRTRQPVGQSRFRPGISRCTRRIRPGIVFPALCGREKAQWQGRAESDYHPSGERSLHRHADRGELGLGAAGARIHHAARSARRGRHTSSGSGGRRPGPDARCQARACPGPAKPGHAGAGSRQNAAPGERKQAAACCPRPRDGEAGRYPGRHRQPGAPGRSEPGADPAGPLPREYRGFQRQHESPESRHDTGRAAG